MKRAFNIMEQSTKIGYKFIDSRRLNNRRKVSFLESLACLYCAVRNNEDRVYRYNARQILAPYCLVLSSACIEE